MANAQPHSDILLRAAVPDDAQAIAAIDAEHTGVEKVLHWRGLLTGCRDNGGLALVAEQDGDVIAYIVGEVRAWEFGSPPTGWIYAVGVAPRSQGHAVGRRLVDAAREHFAALGVSSLRTMVRRENVELLRFFRSSGFIAGPFVELEVDCD